MCRSEVAEEEGNAVAEAILGRVKRIVCAGLEGVTDAVERVGGPLVMREAVREVERAADRIATQRDKARVQRNQAVARQRNLRGQISTLEGQARFAMERGREDLAQVALSRQMDAEQQVRSLDALIGQAGQQEAAFEEQIAELVARAAQMKREYALFEAGHSGGQDGAVGPDRQTTRKVVQAEATFERAMSSAAGYGFGLNDPHSAAALGEVEDLQRQAALEQRFAELQASMKPPPQDAEKKSGKGTPRP
jgi:phage shock protein A